MAAVSESIVREYFELHGFFVRQQRKFIPRVQAEDDEIDFLVFNPNVQAAASLPFVLGSADLAGVSRAVVAVKGWHSDTFSKGVLANAPGIFRFIEPAAFQHASRAFGTDQPLTKLLVVPALPSQEKARQQSIEVLRSKGVDGVIPFRTMLQDLIDQIEINRNYQKADLLQIIRILKNYGFFKESQMELFKDKRKAAGARKTG